MKLRKLIRLILKENLGSSQQQRFDTAIYLTYVEQHKNNEFKHVSWEEFYSKLNYDNVYNKKIVRFDMSRIYRLADEKEIWLGKHNDVLGEVWIEKDEDGTGDIESHWIKNNNN
jgi:hypothetical protein